MNKKKHQAPPPERDACSAFNAAIFLQPFFFSTRLRAELSKRKEYLLTTQSFLLLLPATPFFLLSPGCSIWQHHPKFPESSLHRTPPPSRLHPILTSPAMSTDERVLRAAVSSHHHSFFIQQLLLEHLLHSATMQDTGSATANKACP